MIIVCHSCGTRFHLADGRVGPRGAKVRCSNCHHRFQVPAPQQAQARRAEREHSPVAEPGGSTSAQKGAVHSDDLSSARPRKPLGDPDLDNPRFLFEGDSTGGTTRPEGAPLHVGDISQSGEITQMHEPGAVDDDPTPAGKAAPTPLMGLDPEVSARQQELARDEPQASEPASATDPLESPFDFGREDDFEPTPVPGREPKLSAELERARGPEAPERLETPAIEADLGPGDEVDEAIAHWDPPTPAAPVRTVEVLRPPATPLRAEARPRSQPVLVPSEPRAMPDVEFPTEPRNPIWVGVLVGVAGIALVSATARLAWRQLAPPSAQSVHALGWSAERIRARTSHDDAGDRTLEIAGVLLGPESAALPRVRVVLVDAAGAPVGSPVDAKVGRPAPTLAEDPELLLADASAADGAGFSITLPAPPARAERFRIELGAPPEPPADPPRDSTTTAQPVPDDAPLVPAPPPEAPPGSAPAAPES
jgi:predicted Zn finger-like uncharacterized protein